MTESNTWAGAFSDHLGCPGGAIQDTACGCGDGTYDTAAAEGVRGTAGDPAVFPRITGSVLPLVTG